MRTRLLLTTTIAAIGIAAVALTACNQQGSEPSLKAGGKDWPSIGGDLGNTRFSTLDQINAGNVKTLGGAWQAKLGAPPEGGGGGGGRGGPGIGDPVRGSAIVVNGKMFVTTAKSAYQLNPKTGEVVWKHELPAATYGLSKGPSAGEGMLFVGLGNSHIVALKQDTGEQVWEAVVGDGEVTDKEVKRGQFIAGGPTYGNGVVVSGLANGDYGIQGRVLGFDAKTGKRLWRFNTTPASKDDPGYDTWPQDQQDWIPAGGGVWAIPAVDPDLGIVYFGVGNAVPQYGGEVRAGDNLFASSVVALDIKTGAIKWYYQVVHHDIFEADLGTPLVLYDATVDGKSVKALAAVSTNGFFYLLDRTTGKPVFPIEERPVTQDEFQKTAKTQPFPVGADQVGNKCVDPATIPAGWKAMCMYDPIDPSIPNGMYPIKSTRAAPLAFNPDTKTFYATAADWPSWIHRFQDPRFFTAGPTVPGMKYQGILAAMNATTNKLVWRKTEAYKIQENGSGFLATKSGLLFHGSTDGNLEAYDQKTGDLLLQFQTGASANTAVTTYSVDGEQYVALGSGPTLWAFKLGGAIKPADSGPNPVPSETTWAGRIIDTDQIVMGPTIEDSGLEKKREAQDEYAFLPARIKVKVGGKVTWTNQGKETHDATAADGSWTTGPVAPGKSATVTFKTVGAFAYTDTQHAWEFGQVNVEAAD